MPENEKTIRWRSPNYPFISMKKALDFIQTLYDRHSRYLVALPVITQDWHLKGSYLAQHVAALASYGLIDVEGEGDARKIKISDLAYKIMLDKRPDSNERDALIREAALNPPIFKKIYNAYQPELPAEHNLEYELVHEYRFNPMSVKDFMAVFKETMDFTNLYKSGIMGDKNKSIEEPEIMQSDKAGIKEVASARVALHPLISQGIALSEREIANYPIGRNLNARIIISGASPVTTDSIKKLMALLDLNKEDLHEIKPDEKAESTEN
jgi:hypothetical protein